MGEATRSLQVLKWNPKRSKLKAGRKAQTGMAREPRTMTISQDIGLFPLLSELVAQLRNFLSEATSEKAQDP
jgi:hypothetical protein